MSKNYGIRPWEDVVEEIDDTPLVPENLPQLFLYDHECDELKNLVILRRQWLFNVMTVILGFKSKTSNKEGEDGKQSTADVAKKLKPSEKDALEEGRADSNVLQKCWENFTDNADVEYLIPCMLPELTEERKEELKDQLENCPWFYMYFDFEKFLPAQIYYQLVCLLGDSKTSSPEDIFTSTVCVLNDVKDYHWKVEYERDSHGLKVGVLSSCEDKLEHIKDIHNNLSSICMDSSLEGLKYYGGPFEVKCPVENCSQCILPYVCYGREEIKDVVTCIKCKQTTDVRSKLGGVTSNKDMDKSYQQYIKKFIHAKKQWRLKQIMDSDHALPEYITDWESKLVVPLGIPANKVKDIKAAHPTQPVLERKEVLRVWKAIAIFNATYENLIKACIEGHEYAAEDICKYVQEITKGSSSAEQPTKEPASEFFWAHVYLQPLETLLIVCVSQKLISKVKSTYHQISWYCQEVFDCQTSQIFPLNYTVKTVHIKVATAVVSVAFIAASIIFYLLLLSGDVELNPGPAIFSVSFFLCFIGMTSVHLVHAPVIRQVMSDNNTTGEGATGSTSLPPSLSGNSDSDIAGIVTGVFGMLTGLIGAIIAIAVFSFNVWKHCLQPVRLKIEPNGTNVIGKDYSLTCTAMTDIPGDTFEFSWIYNNAPVDGKVDSSDTKSKLSFEPLNGSHKGEYTCKCSLKQRRGCFSRILLPNLDGSISYHLDVTDPIISATIKDDKYPIVGKSYKLECTITGAEGFTPKYQWMRDDVDIQGETTHSLSFDCLKFYDRGRYRCRVTIECDLLTEPLSGTSNPVDVRLSEPSISATLKDSVCPTLGEQYSLECTISATDCLIEYHDTTCEITWYKNGTRLHTDYLQLSNAKSVQYELESLKYSHRGRYTCEVTITCGLVNALPRTASLKATSNQVDVQLSEPKLKATLSLHPKDGNLVLGKKYELKCNPELDIPGMDIDCSKLDCTYKWHKKGKEEPIDITTKGILSLKSFEFSDAGCYTCTVTVKKNNLLDSDLTVTEERDVEAVLAEKCREEMKEKYKTMQFDPIDNNWTRRHVIKLSLENHGKGKPGDGNKGTLKVSEIYKCSKHITVLKGKPGAGKTTLMRTISRDWSLGDIEEFSEKILILVIIRNHRDYSLKNIIYQSCPWLSSRKYEYLLQCLDSGQGEGFVFLLDGLDEYHESPQDIQPNASQLTSAVENILSANILKKATIIATSRYSAYLLDKINHDNACSFEIKGFLEDEVFDYFKERFKGDDDKYREVERYLTDNPNMVKLCYIPLHCAIMANILFEKHKEDPPKTETKFFEMHTRCRIVRSVCRQGNRLFFLRKLDKLEGENKRLFKDICKLAYHATMERKQSLDEMELEKFELKCDSFHSHQGNINGGLGLLVITPSITREGLPNSTYSFTHLAVQEFCAAFHIAKLPQPHITKIIEDEKCRNHLNSAWKFICGLLDFTNNLNGALEVFRTLMEKYTNEGKKLLFKIQCAHETQEQEPCIVLYKSLKEITILGMTPPELSLFMDTMKILGSANTELPDLESIILDCNQIEDEGAEILSGALRKMPNLQVLNLGKNQIGDEGNRSLFGALESMTSLQELELYSNEIGPKGIEAVSEKISGKMLKLKRLDLNNNKIGEEGAKVLSGALGKMPKLQYLNLGRNKIGYGGVKALSKVLKSMKELQDLNLAGNEIGDGGVKALSTVLKSMKELERLNLERNEIGVEGIKDLLKNMDHLQVLVLRENKIGVEGVSSLLGALDSMTSLQKLFLNDNGFSEEEADEIRSWSWPNTPRVWI